MKIPQNILVLSLMYSATSFAIFKDEIERSGIDFVHFNGMSGEFYFHEMMGAGVALFDYDNDGDLDIYFSQGNMIGEKATTKAIYTPKHELPLTDRLYRNDSIDGKLKFTDVTEIAGIKADGYGMGVTTGDIDNDGDIDIYLTNFGDNQLWLNNGDGTYAEGIHNFDSKEAGWSVSASFFDYDKDGYLDLYVVNYVDYSIDMPVECRSYDGALDYCSPQGFRPLVDSLYHNNGDGTFTNVSSRSGIFKEKEPGLGVVSADFNKDGWVDLYVANDGAPNILWMNNRKGGFENKAMQSGAAVNMTGVPEASMGVDAADFDNDGDEDLFMTHLNRQTNTLYKNNGKAWFFDAGVSMGVASSSFKYTGFGTLWFDFDNDGYLDLLSANGAVTKEPLQVIKKYKHPLMQQNQLWKNLGNGKYKEVSASQDPSFLREDVSRGAAFGDLNNDGLIDVVISNNAGVPHLLINHNNKAKWIGFKLKRKDLNRSDFGALVELTIGSKKIYRRLKTDGSYASSHDSRVLIGIPETSGSMKVKIYWSDGVVQDIKKIITNKYTTINRD